MRQVDVIGVGITPFGKHADATVRILGAEAIAMALADAGVAPAEVGLLVHGNAMAGLLDGQEMIRGQVVAADAGLAGVPVVNVENACATSSSALHVALAGIRAGMYDTAVVCGWVRSPGTSPGATSRRARSSWRCTRGSPRITRPGRGRRQATSPTWR
jgi:acetyl-CoA acetyltransferase